MTAKEITTTACITRLPKDVIIRVMAKLLEYDLAICFTTLIGGSGGISNQGLLAYGTEPESRGDGGGEGGGAGFPVPWSDVRS